MNIPETLTTALKGIKEVDSAGTGLNSGDVLVYVGKADVVLNMPDLYIGTDRSYETKVLQALLNLNGYKLEIDGIYGTETRNSVSDFQTRKNVNVNYKGTVGRKTWKKLLRED